MKVKYAGLGVRFVANIIDLIILQIVTYSIYSLFQTKTDEEVILEYVNSSASEMVMQVFAGAIISVLIVSFFIASKYQATPGKILMSLKVVDVNLKKIGF